MKNIEKSMGILGNPWKSMKIYEILDLELEQEALTASSGRGSGA